MFRVNRLRHFPAPARTPRSFIQPVVDASIRSTDGFTLCLSFASWGLFCATYAIITNWIYEGYVDLWHGTYGLEDDDDDDD